MESGQQIESRNQRGARENGPRNHRDSLRANTYRTHFWQFMVHLLDPPYSPKRLTAFFNQLASYDTIGNWRYGRAVPPDWAIDIMRHAARKRIDKLNAAIESLKKIPPQESPGIRGTRHLRAWRERKARERDEQAKPSETNLEPGWLIRDVRRANRRAAELRADEDSVRRALAAWRERKARERG